LGWDRTTLRKGLHELNSGIVCVDAVAQRGRKPMEAKLTRLGGLEGENHYFRRWDALKPLVLQGFDRQKGL